MERNRGKDLHTDRESGEMRGEGERQRERPEEN